MIDRMLIAVDESDYSRRAATLGLALAKPYDIEVDALHAVEGGALTGNMNEGEEVQDDSGDEILAEISKLADDIGVTVATHLVEGQASETIIRQARESGANLIVMGRQGRTGVGERLLGSVTERVLRNTDVPVLIIPNNNPIDTEDVTYTHVLATTDGSETAERAAPHAADIAHHHSATLHVITVVDIKVEGGAFSAGGVSEEFIEQREEQGRESVDRFSERSREEMIIIQAFYPYRDATSYQWLTPNRMPLSARMSPAESPCCSARTVATRALSTAIG